MIVVILGEKGHTWFQSFKLNEKEHKEPKVTWDHPAKYMGSNIRQKPSDVIDALDIRLTNSVDSCDYPLWFVKLFDIQLFIHVVKHFKIFQQAIKQEKGRLTQEKGRLTYA